MWQFGGIKGWAALTGFSFEKCMGILPGQKLWHNKRVDHLNKVTVRQGSTVLK